VGERVVNDPSGVAVSTITELAAACDTSVTTVIRFCRAIGLAGYPELRLMLATEAGRAEGGSRVRASSGEIAPEDSVAEVVAKIAAADAQALDDTAANLEMDALAAVIDTVANARRIDVYGVGASGVVAQDLCQKLHRIGKTAFAWPDTHLALTSAAVLTDEDVAFGISHTGTTTDVLDSLAEARRQGATTVALTNFPRSPISDVADLVLTTAARETTFRSGAMASRLAQLMVIDCIFVGVAQQSYDDTLAALAVTLDAVRSRQAPSARPRPAR
jgi:DNA-binding MurR/RpiR family transcriptional regulator